MLCMITEGVCDYCLSTKQVEISHYPEVFSSGKYQLLGELGRIQNSRSETRLCTELSENTAVMGQPTMFNQSFYHIKCAIPTGADILN